MTTYICYHYPCPDGVFAALAAHIGLGSSTASLKFVPLTVFQPREERLAMVDTVFVHADVVYLLDFSGGPEFVLKLCSVAARAVYLLDHHKTALEDMDALKAAGSIPSNLHVTLDMARSGATIARDAFAVRDTPLPPAMQRLFAYIEDNDLWRHALPHSKVFAAGFADLGLELDVNKNPGLWDTLKALDADALIASGAAVLERNNRIIAEECASAFVVALPGYTPPVTCLAVVSRVPDLRSSLGNELARISAERGLAPAGVIAYVEEGMGAAAAAESFKVSVRSLGDFDTTILTRALGGGGHKNASSCIIPRAAFNAWKVDATPALA